MIAAVEGRGHPRHAEAGRSAEGDGQHDRVPVRHHGGAHRLLGIVALRHLAGRRVGQDGAREQPRDRREIDYLLAHPERDGRRMGAVDLAAVALAVVVGDEPAEPAFGRHLVGQGHRIEPAGADHQGRHDSSPVFLGAMAPGGYGALNSRSSVIWSGSPVCRMSCAC